MDPGRIKYSLSVGNNLEPKEAEEETEYKPAPVTAKWSNPNGSGMWMLGVVPVNEES